MVDGKTEAWRTAAHEVIKKVAEQNSIVVSDMVVTALESAGLGLDNYSPLGGVFTRAAKEGLLSKTTDTQQSTRAKSNSAKTVWLSNVYGTDDLTPEARALNKLLIAALDANAETVRYASFAFRAGGLNEKSHKKAVEAFSAIQDKYGARIAAAVEEYERVGGRA